MPSGLSEFLDKVIIRIQGIKILHIWMHRFGEDLSQEVMHAVRILCNKVYTQLRAILPL